MARRLILRRLSRLGLLTGLGLLTLAAPAAPAGAEPEAPASAPAAANPASAPAVANPASAPASAPQASRGRQFIGMFFFWSGAVLVMALVGRIVFREQINEIRTLRLMRNSLGEYYPEFAPVAVTAWVQRAAPHLWKGWREGRLGAVEGFTTEAFRAASAAAFAAAAREGHQREARLVKVLKVHPLGLAPVGEGPPPKDLELVLRVESRAQDCLRDAAGKILAGAAAERQVQQFWTLRHDGAGWRLHAVEPAVEDRTDLARRPPVPPLMAWRRPEPQAPDPP